MQTSIAGLSRASGLDEAFATRSGLSTAQRSNNTARPTVLVYRNELLAISETFIKEQMQAYSRWRGILIGRRLVAGLSLDGLDTHLLSPSHSYFLSRVWWRLSRDFGVAPPPLVESLKREKPMLLHAHFGLDAVDAWPLARALNLPMLVTLHGYDIHINREWWETCDWGPKFRDYPRRLLELAARPRVLFIAVSEATRRRAVEFGIDPGKVVVRHIGVDVQRFSPRGPPISGRKRRVLFVGRLVEKKGCEYLINAAALVTRIVPDARFVVVGDGALKAPLQILAEKLGVCVEFRGALSSAQVQTELAEARVLCLPSVTAANGDAEGFGLILLEAQASGVPVVTSAKGGKDEGVRDGETGLTFEERDVDALTQRLVKILTDDKIATSFAVAGPQFVSQLFDIGPCTESLESLYDDMAGREIGYSPLVQNETAGQIEDAIGSPMSGG